HNDALHVTILGVPRCPLDAALRGDASHEDGLGPQSSKNGVEIVAVEGAEAWLQYDPIVGLWAQFIDDFGRRCASQERRTTGWTGISEGFGRIEIIRMAMNDGVDERRAHTPTVCY